MSMEHNGGNQNLSRATLCRMNCGFYANASFEGMCSKCYKDVLKRRQPNASPSPVPARSSPTGNSEVNVPISEQTTSSSQTPASMLGGSGASASGGTTAMPLDTSTTPSIDTASPTVPAATPVDKEEDKEEASTSGAMAAMEDKDNAEKEKKPKKNRCHTCKKKVGLTGFQCRCGDLFCGLHRYSDKHDCSFNYKQMAQEQIRKNNPVVVGEKIQKI